MSKAVQLFDKAYNYNIGTDCAAELWLKMWSLYHRISHDFAKKKKNFPFATLIYGGPLSKDDTK